MFLHITDTIFADFPNLILGVLTTCGIDNANNRDEILQMLRTEEHCFVEKFDGIPVIEHPHIRSWREAYRIFGSKPKKYPSSIENLARRVLKGTQLPYINNLVALYNIISLRYLLPAGGEDLTRIRGDVWLTKAGHKESSVRLLGESEERPPYPGEIIYKDDLGAICRRWNWKETERTKLSHETRYALLVLEALPPVTRDVVETAIGELTDLITLYCGGAATTAILDRETPDFVLHKGLGNS